MLTLPPPSLIAIAGLPIPSNLGCLPNHFALHATVWAASAYPGLVPDLSKQAKWSAFKARVGERCDALKITNFYIRLYEDDDLPVRVMFQFSVVPIFNRWLARRARHTGFGDLVGQSLDQMDPERLSAFTQSVVGVMTDQMIQSADADDDWEAEVAAADRYWKEVHPTLPLEKRQRVERDAQYFASLLMFGMHNAISVMAYGQSLSSLVQRVLHGPSGPDRDKAMCMAVRIDNNLREHPLFHERYLIATRTDDAAFLRSYNNTAPPLANGVRYRGLYFLLATLDCYGLEDRLSNGQVLSLCDLAKLDRLGNRIEDEGYLAKRRAEYRRHKFLAMSRH